MVNAEAFLAIEKSLYESLQKSWNRIFVETEGAVRKALFHSDYGTATRLANRLSLDQIVDDNKAAVRYYTTAALLFGASRLTNGSPKKTDLNKQDLDQHIERTTVLLKNYVTNQLEADLRRSLLDLISKHSLYEDTTPLSPSNGKLEIKKSNPCHEPTGSPKGGQFCSTSGPKLFVSSYYSPPGYKPPDTSSHKIFRHKYSDSWGYSHSYSRTIATAAADMMAIPGYSGYRLSGGMFDPGLASVAKEMLSAIHSDTVGSEELLYHGFENIRQIDWKIGDTFDVPLLATSGEGGNSASYGIRSEESDQEGLPTVLEFVKGTPIVAYSKNKASEAKESGYVYNEAITAGRFRVVGVRKETYRWNALRGPIEVTIVTVEPVATFDPETKAWRDRG
jgi:hypothetical protein